MTQLTDARKTFKVKLPSYPDVEVVLYDGLLTGQFGLLEKIEGDYDKGLKSLEFLMQSWSFVDEKEEPLPITIDNLKKLPAKDFTVLMNRLEELMKEDEGKKKKN